MRTFWLYCGNLLVTGVRCNADASNAQVISHAFDAQLANPCISPLFPDYSPAQIKRFIVFSTVIPN